MNDPLEQWRASMTDADVVERARAELSRLCKGGGWRMTIPVNFDYDSDLILGEAIRRLKVRAVAPPGGEPDLAVLLIEAQKLIGLATPAMAGHNATKWLDQCEAWLGGCETALARGVGVSRPGGTDHKNTARENG